MILRMGFTMWTKIHQFKSLTCFGTYDIIRHLRLLDKYPNDRDVIEEMMCNFYQHTDYSSEIKNLFDFYLNNKESYYEWTNLG